MDAKANEMEGLVDGEKAIIIRGAAGMKMPYGRVIKNDSFRIDKSDYGNMDDWLPAGDINSVKAV